LNRTGKRRRRRQRGGLGGGARRRPIAAIDLGTNNCRLLIAEPDGQGGFRVVDSFSRVVRLGEKIGKTGVLSEAAMDRTVAALKVCAERIKKDGVGRVRAVATEACRQASNVSVLVERAAREANIRLDIVSSAEEARLTAFGCVALVGADYDGALVFDIGGGSTEIVWLRREGGAPIMKCYHSTPIGVLTLAEADDGKSYAAMRAHMLELFSAVRREMDAVAPFDTARHHLLGTSGTVTTLAGIALKLPRYVRSKVDGTWHDSTAMDDVVRDLVRLGRRARTSLGCVGEERADLIVPGCAIYEAIRTLWPCARLRVADRGLREGILRDMLTEKKK
jgi:exopolyphosphatase / guanosine-5'-triphosphate,3'-diphosphate pyrophosphatase